MNTATTKAVPVFLAALLLLPAGPARAGALADFEAGSARSPAPSGGPHGSGSWDAVLAELFMRVCVDGMVYGGLNSTVRLEPDSDAALDVVPREWGESLIPFARADVAYQWVKSDVEALDVSAEAGYGPFAARFIQTRFEEKQPRDDLTLTRWYGLYRMSLGSQLEIDMGFGSLAIRGDDHTDRFSFTLPVLFYLIPGCGVEFRPAWSDRVEEYDVALLAGYKFVSLKAGYRWLHSPGESLDGPYAGLSVHF